jgi:hypothetical protein
MIRRVFIKLFLFFFSLLVGPFPLTKVIEDCDGLQNNQWKMMMGYKSTLHSYSYCFPSFHLPTYDDERGHNGLQQNFFCVYLSLLPPFPSSKI